MSKEKYTGPRVKDTETFIKKSIWAHGEKYEYSEAVYTNYRTTVKITCPKHGVFEQLPGNHFAKRGCPSCAKDSVTTNVNEFISSAKRIHGDKYNYSKVKYENNRTPVEIICPNHGSFHQRPYNHTGCKQGCPDCGTWTTAAKKTYKTSEFIKMAKNIHGDKYSYSEVGYKGSKVPVKILCKDHGEFHQTPNKHLCGSGCPACGGVARVDTSLFIKKSMNVHGNKYDYSLSKYINNSTKVSIICPVHGVFEQNPHDHSSGHGCQKCSFHISGWGYRRAGYVSNLYVLSFADLFIKVGLAVDVEYRIHHLRYHSGYDITLIHSIEGLGSELFRKEQEILRSGEFLKYYPHVKFPGYTECLDYSEKDKIIDFLNKAP